MSLIWGSDLSVLPPAAPGLRIATISGVVPMCAPDGAQSRPATCGRSNEDGHACTRGQGYCIDDVTCAKTVSGASAGFHPMRAVWLGEVITSQRDEAAIVPATFHLTPRDHWDAQRNGPT